MSLADQAAIEAKTSTAMTASQRRRDTSPFQGSFAVGGMSKRVADIVIAGIVLFVLSPLFVLTALLVRCLGPGPVFFGHERIGCGGRTFRCLKFRTMRRDAEQVLRSVLEADPALAREWHETRKLRCDPRITRIGRVLREYSLDELPQLINVIRGEMSLVGPRPVVAAELARYGQRAAHYLSARPGITGLWQISGRSDTSYTQRVELDSRYVREWSFANDVTILVRTIPAVLSSRGSY
jgi:exopolysaccharide production protein ExoY